MLYVAQSARGLLQWQARETQLPQHIVKPEKSAGHAAHQFGQMGQSVARVQVQCFDLVLQVPAMSSIKKRLGPRVDVPSMNFFKLRQPSRGQHPTGTRADQNQLLAGHRLRHQPIGDLRRGWGPALLRPPRPQVPMPSARYVHAGILWMVQTLILRKHEYLGLSVHLCLEGETGFEG